MKLINNMKLSRKIATLTVLFLFFLVFIGFQSIKELSNVNSRIMELNDQRMTPIIELENIKSKVEYIRSSTMSLQDEEDEQSRKTAQDEINGYISDINTGLTKYKSNSEYKDLFEKYDAFIAAKDNFLKAQEERFAQQQPGIQSQQNTGEEQQQQGPPEDMQNFDKAKLDLVSAFDGAVNKYVDAAKQTYSESMDAYRFTMAALIIAVVMCVFITIIFSIIIIRSVTKPIRSVILKLKEISQSSGDLTQRIGYNSKDEIGELSKSFDMFMGKLQSIIGEVAVSAETISSSSEDLNNATILTTQSLEQISSTIAQIAASTSDGAAAAEETTASLTEAAKFSESTAEASRNTAYNSKKAKEAAEVGASKITEIIGSINDIEVASKEVSGMIKDLDNSSRKIGDIIEIITSIAEQTNLLALNAAIEAARAGEAGRGFSVVAEEIRKLADESNHAAKEIYELVKENQLKSASAVNSVSLVSEKVTVGVEKTAEVRESIENIIYNIQNIVNQVEQIDSANNQQAQSTKEIEKAISGIATNSNEIAGGTENINAGIEEQLSTMTEIERTTETLSQMSKKLTEITSGFKVK